MVELSRKRTRALLRLAQRDRVASTIGHKTAWRAEREVSATNPDVRETGKVATSLMAPVTDFACWRTAPEIRCKGVCQGGAMQRILRTFVPSRSICITSKRDLQFHAGHFRLPRGETTCAR